MSTSSDLSSSASDSPAPARKEEPDENTKWASRSGQRGAIPDVGRFYRKRASEGEEGGEQQQQQSDDDEREPLVSSSSSSLSSGRGRSSG